MSSRKSEIPVARPVTYSSIETKCIKKTVTFFDKGSNTPTQRKHVVWYNLCILGSKCLKEFCT